MSEDRDKPMKLRSESDLFQQREVFRAGNPCGAQVVQDDEDRNGSVTGDDNGALDARFGVDPMIAFFPNQPEPCEFKDPTQTLIGERGDAGHATRTRLEGDLHVLRRNERGRAPTAPVSILRDEALFLEDVLQGAHALAFFQEKAHGLR